MSVRNAVVFLLLACCNTANSFLVSARKINWRIQETCIFGSDCKSEEILSEHKVTLRKPMGLILEESDEYGASCGVMIKQIDPAGETGVACRSKNADICVRDKILSVNGKECADDSFDNVMDLLIDGPDEIDLILGRPENAVIVKWSNGIAVAAKPGDYFGQIAQDEAFVKIPYSCSNGGCGTCEQQILFTKDGSQRYIRPCVSRVPKTSSMIIVNGSDRYEPPTP
mmetsp:Transcript_5608/g.8345  ORF Transcript_5608/g.8345 Transcript_5608/m.8345 type:complete len:226 (+) Transcript_5608:53-730(+)